MNIPRPPHRWSVSTAEATAIQRRLANAVESCRPPQPIRLVAGVDAAFTAEQQLCVAGVVLWDLAQREVIEQHTASRKLSFPYVPGLLSFRETPAVLAALRKLRCDPDAVMCDAHGIAHPRRFGLACHVGVICRVPTVGCAKSRLIGTHREPRLERGSTSPLVHKGNELARVLRTKSGVKPVFVSVGHLCDLESAVSLVLDCATRYRLPEPTRLADRLVARAKGLY